MLSHNESVPPAEESRQALEELFTRDYWDADNAIPTEPLEFDSKLSTRADRLTAATFESGVARTIAGDIKGHELAAGATLDLKNCPAGTLLQIDLETIRDGVAPSAGYEIDYDLKYPGQVRRFLNADADDLINIASQQNRDGIYRPARLKLKNLHNGWQYTRVAWYGIVVPDKKTHRSIASYAHANSSERTKDLFQQDFSFAREMLANIAVGHVYTATVKDMMGKSVQQYQRLKGLCFYQEPAHWLAKEVYKQHYSSSFLGRRALTHLSSACLARDSK